MKATGKTSSQSAGVELIQQIGDSADKASKPVENLLGRPGISGVLQTEQGKEGVGAQLLEVAANPRLKACLQLLTGAIGIIFAVADTAARPGQYADS